MWTWYKPAWNPKQKKDENCTKLGDNHWKINIEKFEIVKNV